jgi:hypothetical protein
MITRWPCIAVTVFSSLLVVVASAHSAFERTLWEHQTILSDSTTESWRHARKSTRLCRELEGLGET